MVSSQAWQELTIDDFIAAFGGDEKDRVCIENEVARYDFGYRRLSAEERDAAILKILKELDGFTQVGEHRHDIWTMSWEETRQRYLKSGCEIDALDPPFMGATPYVRLLGDYALPRDANFEHYWYRIYRRWIFQRFLGDQKRVFEFGCGSGFNLATIGELFPDKELHGLDWAQPAVDLVNQVGKDHDLCLTGRRFDFFNIDPSIDVGPGDAVGTFCALEQTGARFDSFFNWLLERRPDIVISMEPAIEHYDTGDLHDYLAWSYVSHRQYLNGYFAAVREAAEQGKVEILWEHRPRFGSFYHEGYTLIVWRPL